MDGWKDGGWTNIFEEHDPNFRLVSLSFMLQNVNIFVVGTAM